MSCWLLPPPSTGAIHIGPKKATVAVANYLGDNVEVNIRCQSQDNELGWKQLNYGESFEFTFRPSLRQKRQFYCHMVWVSAAELSHWFDINIQWRDKPKCSRCLWKIRTVGPCMFNYSLMLVISDEDRRSLISGTQNAFNYIQPLIIRLTIYRYI